MEEALSLYELNSQVANAIAQQFNAPLWITAEVAQYNVASNGHAYLELIEKDARTGITKARAKAMIYANRVWLVNETFQMGTGQPLRAGLNIMILVKVSMHPAYGYTLEVVDIEPAFTLGEMQRRRQEILQRLQDEGVMDINKSLPLPRPTQRIAVISADTAAGFGDFCHQLDHNEWGLCFYYHLFPARMQGEQTESSVIQALNHIYKYVELFDVVVIIRGGGSVVDLNSFDSYELALNIANFPLPVIVGIGHERDNTVLDEVAHTSVKTPTAAAAFLIENLANELLLLNSLQDRLLDATQGRLEREMLRLDRYSTILQGAQLRMDQQLNQLQLTEERIKFIVQMRLDKEQQTLDYMERTVQMAQPANLLKRGFSIARRNGKAIKDSAQLHPGDVVETETANGRFSSVVQ